MKNRKNKSAFLILFLFMFLLPVLLVPVSAAELPDEVFPESPVIVIETVVEIPPSLFAQSESYGQYLTDMNAAAGVLREGMCQRLSEVPVFFKCDQSAVPDGNAIIQVGLELFDMACIHTGEPDQGDYLYWSLGYITVHASYYQYYGYNYIEYTYSVEYYTTSAQEEMVDAAVAELVPLLRLDQVIPDYEKIFNIYHYICDNVVYDYDNLYDESYNLKYSCYAALIDQKAVCQGYSLLFYRLALEAGIDNRVIVGMAWNGVENGRHAWNMVELDDVYYYLDSTWDAGRQYSDYFLMTSEDFWDHVPDAGYSDTLFYAEYPQAQTSYLFSEEQGGWDHTVSLEHRAVYTDRVEPSCEETGLTEGCYCSSCGEVLLGREIIPADSHIYIPQVTPATCGAGGFTTYTCDICHDSYDDDFTPATGEHIYQGDWDESCDVCSAIREVAVDTTPMYRLYNPNSGEHFYTGSIEERDVLVTAGWVYEGVAWNAPTKTGEPVYRLFNPNSGDHHYTMSVEEREMLVVAGWIYEGVCWNSASSDNLPLYRLYNPNADCGSHHYTGSMEEREMLVGVGWIFEGIGWFGTLN